MYAFVFSSRDTEQSLCKEPLRSVIRGLCRAIPLIWRTYRLLNFFEEMYGLQHLYKNSEKL